MFKTSLIFWFVIWNGLAYSFISGSIICISMANLFTDNLISATQWNVTASSIKKNETVAT